MKLIEKISYFDNLPYALLESKKAYYNKMKYQATNIISISLIFQNFLNLIINNFIYSYEKFEDRDRFSWLFSIFQILCLIIYKALSIKTSKRYMETLHSGYLMLFFIFYISFFLLGEINTILDNNEGLPREDAIISSFSLGIKLMIGVLLIFMVSNMVTKIFISVIISIYCTIYYTTMYHTVL